MQILKKIIISLLITIIIILGSLFLTNNLKMAKLNLPNNSEPEVSSTLSDSIEEKIWGNIIENVLDNKELYKNFDENKVFQELNLPKLLKNIIHQDKLLTFLESKEEELLNDKKAPEQEKLLKIIDKIKEWIKDNQPDK